MKKKALVAVGIALSLLLIYLVGSGFVKDPWVVVVDYTVSADGKEITLQVSSPTSAGYIRDVAVFQQGRHLYLDPHSAFGGINGRIGAKDTFTIELEEDTNRIAIYRNTNCYEEVLKKAADGSWRWTKQ